MCALRAFKHIVFYCIASSSVSCMLIKFSHAKVQHEVKAFCCNENSVSMDRMIHIVGFKMNQMMILSCFLFITKYSLNIIQYGAIFEQKRSDINMFISINSTSDKHILSIFEQKKLEKFHWTQTVSSMNWWAFAYEIDQKWLLLIQWPEDTFKIDIRIEHFSKI